MTNQTLEKLEKLCRKTTEGLWESKVYHTNSETHIHTAAIFVGKKQTVIAEMSLFDDEEFNDLIFMAASHAAIPELIDEIRRLQKEIQHFNVCASIFDKEDRV